MDVIGAVGVLFNAVRLTVNTWDRLAGLQLRLGI